MVEKVWVCTIECGYVPQHIPYDKQPRTCPKCGRPCREADFVKGEDFKAILADYEREGNVFKSVKADKKD